MKTNILINLMILAFSALSSAQTYIYKCPDPDFAMSPEVEAKVNFDKRTGLYTYKFKIKNKSDALVPIGYFKLVTFSSATDIMSHNEWKFISYEDNELFWSSKSEGIGANIKFDKDGMPYGPPGNAYDIHPGKSIEGFEFKSPYPPGPIKIKFDGSPLKKADIVTSDGKSVPDFENTIPNDELQSLLIEGEKTCPGFVDGDFDVSTPREDGLIDVTTGPVPPTRVAAKLRIRKINEKKWRGSPAVEEPDIQILPTDTGKIQVMLFGSHDLDVTKIDLSSLTFGQVEAKPLKTVILNDFRDKDGELDDNEIKEHIKKNNVRHLLMEFNLDDVDIRCDTDHALFLKGKIGTKDLYGAVRIKNGSCMDKKNNAKELKKIRAREAKDKKEAEEEREKKKKH